MPTYSKTFCLLFTLLLACNQYKSEYSRIFEQMYNTLEVELQNGLEAFESTMTNVAFVLQTKGDSLDKIWVLRRGEEIIDKTESLIFWIENKKDKLFENQNPEKVLEIRNNERNPFLDKLADFTQFLNQKNRLWKLKLPPFEDLTTMENIEKITEEGEEIPDDFMNLKFENVSTESALLVLIQKQMEALAQGQKLLDKLTENYQAEVVHNFKEQLKVNILSENDSILKTEVLLSFPIFENKKKLYPKKLIWKDSIYNFRTAKANILWNTKEAGESTQIIKAVFYDPENQQDTTLTLEKTFWVNDTIQTEEAEALEIIETPENEAN